MFAYIQIIDSQNKVSYGYVNFAFSNDVLSITTLKGMKHSPVIKIPISQISDISEDNYYSWNRIKFTYNKEQYSFIYSGFGEFDYLKEHLMQSILA
ncbi:hypothetical protein [Companilactobacillus halodurans]|uniref:GRAM domain-containing protein n=1 Tax=Companilactobacillus halodurans TaxID=2584183 RepID=A0A5P0ZLU8_9LACO|nr:hypothetical protein [Companilactobacillus halodurans]MQS75188.1 hypothetical protein [Companilactobacillus halodurans]MQS97547.1 hypothetical protein [Companilactobacillus halodurans]